MTTVTDHVTTAARLSAGLARQILYTTTRVGVYTTLFEKFSGPDGKPPGFFTKAGCGEFVRFFVLSPWYRTATGRKI